MFCCYISLRTQSLCQYNNEDVIKVLNIVYVKSLVWKPRSILCRNVYIELKAFKRNFEYKMRQITNLGQAGLFCAAEVWKEIYLIL